MVLVVITGVVMATLVTWATRVLVRRERKRLGISAEAHRIESTATRGIRDARRHARSLHHIGGAGGISRLRDRDWNH
jgi:dihydroorotate dehydrogenase